MERDREAESTIIHVLYCRHVMEVLLFVECLHPCVSANIYCCVDQLQKLQTNTDLSLMAKKYYRKLSADPGLFRHKT